MHVSIIYVRGCIFLCMYLHMIYICTYLYYIYVCMYSCVCMYVGNYVCNVDVYVCCIYLSLHLYTFICCKYLYVGMYLSCKCVL